MAEKLPEGSWVEIRRTVLEAGERAPQVPDDTAEVPLEMRVKGYLTSAAAVGEEAEIETVLGHTYRGKLHDPRPSYEHRYGPPVPELLDIGQELKDILRSAGGEN